MGSGKVVRDGSAEEVLDMSIKIGGRAVIEVEGRKVVFESTATLSRLVEFATVGLEGGLEGESEEELSTSEECTFLVGGVGVYSFQTRGFLKELLTKDELV